MKTSNYLKILLAGVLFAVLAQVIHSIGAFFGMPYFTDPDYLCLWSRIMMPGAGNPPVSFYFISISFSIITGLLFSVVYYVLENHIPEKTTVKRGLVFGIMLFAVNVIPIMLSTSLIFNVPSGLVWIWALDGLIIDLLGGMLIARVLK